MTSWFANRFIATKILMVFCAVVAVGVAAAALNASNLARLSEAQDWAEHTYKVLDLSKDVLGSLTRQEHAMSAAVLGGRPVVVDRANARAIDRAVAKLQMATADNHSQQVRIEGLKSALAAWRAQAPGTAARLAAADAILAVLRTIDAEEQGLLEIRTARARDAFRTSDRVNVLSPVIASVIALALGILLHQFIARPIADLTKAMRRLAEGDDAVVVPNMSRRDEIGAMSRALDVFKSGMHEAERLREDRLTLQRDGEVQRAALVKTMAKRFETIVGSVVQAVSASATKMQGSAEELRELADRTSGQVRDVAVATREVSATMQVAAEEAATLSSSVGEISARMEHSERVALQAVEEANRTSATIEGLSGAAKRIDAIVDLINAVARQTNLLALNATIESARAGEAGRGFAVVAAEVKVLADQTAEATEDIRRQIEEIQIAASGSVAAIGQICHTIREMARITGEVNDAVEMQRDGTMATALSTKATAGVATEVSGRLTLVSADALTTGRAATDLLAAARDLAHQSQTLREETGRFVASVRTG